MDVGKCCLGLFQHWQARFVLHVWLAIWYIKKISMPVCIKGLPKVLGIFYESVDAVWVILTLLYKNGFLFSVRV